ncbi:MAG: cohesin domain-containing protein, partial [Microgenomates group bacterium]
MRKGYWLLIFLIFLILVPFVFGQVAAANFQFDPTSSTVKAGEKVSIKVNINAASDELNGADANILYDSTYLKVDSVTAGSYFPTVTNDTSTSGKIYIAGMVDDPASSASGE